MQLTPNPALLLRYHESRGPIQGVSKQESVEYLFDWHDEKAQRSNGRHQPVQIQPE